ncbi:tRNA-dihydrouridine(16/17) synthase [NAD(P)(+)]-like protein [Gurleya vavrai]
MDFFDKLPKPVYILAPMVNNSNIAYRTLARRYNAHLTYTEMVHSMHFNNTKSDPQKNNWFTTDNSDRPLVIQICGNNSQEMLKAALKLQNFCDAIDINFGCPQNIAKVGNYGAFLQKDLKLTKEIIETLSKNLKVPVFCKIRIFKEIEKTIEYAKMIEDAGCSLLVVHGRTIEQKGINTGLADLDQIKAVKEKLKIPVIANGNVLCKEDLDYVLEKTKCDGIMVAETHLHNPLIFSDIKKSCFEVLIEYFELCLIYKTKMVEVKSHTHKILHKILETKLEYREKISRSKSIECLKELIKNLENECKQNDIFVKMEGKLRNIAIDTNN